jgi:4-amino-4-deoxy-L-arabinose transferase-like glycosyltransferase
VRLAGVLVVAAALRVAHVLALRSTPWFEHLVVDAGFYDAWAVRIAAGEWLGTRAFYTDPLYPYLLGGLYALVGRDLLVVRLVQVALSVGTCALVARLGRRVGGPAVGLLAALGFALYKPEIFYVAEVEKTCVSIFLTALGLTLFFETSLPRRLGSGLAFGLAVLTRANMLLVAPLGALALRRDGGGRAALAFVAGFALALAPVAWRNHRVSGEWVLTTTQGGQNFYIGNNPDNLSGSYGALPFVRMNPAFEEDDFRAEAERRVGRALDAREASRFWWDEALRFLRERPGDAARLMLRKLALAWNDFEVADNQDQYTLARDSWVMRFPFPGFGLLAALAAVGALAAFRGSRPVRLLLGFAVVHTASTAAFFVFSRYRIQIVPALLPVAALGAVELWRRLREAPSRRLAADAVAFAAAAAFAFRTIPPFTNDDPRIQAMHLHKVADVWLIADDPARAADVLREAIAVCPTRCPGELDHLLAIEVERGRRDDAVALLRRLTAAHPDEPALAERLRALAGGGRPAGGDSR